VRIAEATSFGLGQSVAVPRKLRIGRAGLFLGHSGRRLQYNHCDGKQNAQEQRATARFACLPYLICCKAIHGPNSKSDSDANGR
jgi:hypothetical protein